jgi:tripartite-type tricarboxylate transporter receptor subunit TctC
METPLNHLGLNMADITLKRRNLCKLITLPALAYLPTAKAQAWPNKPLRLIVGYSAGGGVDAMARLLASRLSGPLGQQVIVENRAGAAGMIAADGVAKAAPDGHTLMLADSSLLIAKSLNPKLILDPLLAFTPVAGAYYSPLMVVANNDFPANDAKTLVKALKAKPGDYSYATSGVGTVHHLGFELLKTSTNSFVVHIPYRGAAQIIPDVISGQVPLGVVSATAGLAQAKAGKLKALALLSPNKLAGTEGISALSEVVPKFDVSPYLFLLLPAGTASDIANKLSAAVKLVMAADDFSATAMRQGAIASYAPPAQLSREMTQETERWSRLIREQKITAE